MLMELVLMLMVSEECVPRLDCVSPGRKRDSKPPTGECATSAGGPSEEVANVDAKQEHDMSRRSQ